MGNMQYASLFYCIVLYCIYSFLTAWAFQNRARSQQLTLCRSLHAEELYTDNCKWRTFPRFLHVQRVSNPRSSGRWTPLSLSGRSVTPKWKSVATRDHATSCVYGNQTWISIEKRTELGWRTDGQLNLAPESSKVIVVGGRGPRNEAAEFSMQTRKNDQSSDLAPNQPSDEWERRREWQGGTHWRRDGAKQREL